MNDSKSINNQISFILPNEKTPSAPKPAVNAINMLISTSKGALPMPIIAFLSASTAYVAGSINIKNESQSGRLSNGNRAPLKKKIGKTTKLTIIWNPSRLCI